MDQPNIKPEEISARPQGNPAERPAKPQGRRQKHGKLVSLIVLGLIVCATVGFGAAWLAVSLHPGSSSSNVVQEMIDSEGKTVVTADEGLITSVASKVSPSVVSIVTTSGSQRSFFSMQMQGAGTGVIISQDGYIMTNNHVVEGASNIAVILSDGTEYENVEVVGSDPLNDIAFIRIDGVSDLVPATLGDSSDVRIGQQVVAIGNALGQFQTTVTSGIISATGRPLMASSADGRSSESLTDLIQTDAAINSGNSGGPLVDMSGRVIGINTAVAADANGIGFAIPINATRGLIEGLLETGKVERAYIGVSYIDITPQIAASEDLGVQRGAYVSAQSGSPIISGSPADKAGIQAEDIITKINNEAVGERSSMLSILGQYLPGKTVSLTVLRDGREIKIDVTLEAYPETF